MVSVAENRDLKSFLRKENVREEEKEVKRLKKFEMNFGLKREMSNRNLM